MSKRSTNLEILLKQKQDIEVKVFILQRQLLGIEKSISKIENSKNETNSSIKSFGSKS